MILDRRPWDVAEAGGEVIEGGAAAKGPDKRRGTSGAGAGRFEKAAAY